jgi:prepilin-type N-terminal cleavage/methylation domain-containing protein
MNEKTDNQGFTFLEVIMVIAIFTISMVTLAGLQTASIKGNANASKITEASTWASTQLEMLKTVSYDSLANGQTTKGDYAINWSVSNGAVSNTKNITITVTWTGEGRSKNVVFNAIRSS